MSGKAARTRGDRLTGCSVIDAWHDYCINADCPGEGRLQVEPCLTAKDTSTALPLRARGFALRPQYQGAQPTRA